MSPYPIIMYDSATPLCYISTFYMWPGRFTDLSCLPTTSSNSKHVFTLGQTLIRSKFCQVVKLMRQIWLCLILPKILVHWFEYRYNTLFRKKWFMLDEMKGFEKICSIFFLYLIFCAQNETGIKANSYCKKYGKFWSVFFAKSFHRA